VGSRFGRSELQQRAVYRRAASLYGIGAALDGELSQRGQTGRTWLCAATDTVNGFRWVEVDAPSASHGLPIDPEFIERFVEREAGRFAIETRLDDLAGASPLRIELYLADAA
jgi:hypothetical protein